MTAQSQRFDRWIFTSVGLHAALFATVVFVPNFFPGNTESWGTTTGGTGGIDVKIVGSAGIALPSPVVTRKDAVANDSPGLYKKEEAPPAPPPDKAEPIPDPNAKVKKPVPAPPKPSASKSAPPSEPIPPNAVPSGEGGKPAIDYGRFTTGAGSAGVGFGDGVFGDKYGYYVDAMTRRISQNWLQSLVDSRIQRAPRVYLGFQIARDGTISDVEVKQSSGIPSLDRSAMRAILASNKLAPLPADYRGSSVDVTFYFEYSR